MVQPERLLILVARCFSFGVGVVRFHSQSMPKVCYLDNNQYFVKYRVPSARYLVVARCHPEAKATGYQD